MQWSTYPVRERRQIPLRPFIAGERWISEKIASREGPATCSTEGPWLQPLGLFCCLSMYLIHLWWFITVYPGKYFVFCFVLMNLNFNKMFKTHTYLLLKIKTAYETFFITSQSFENQKIELICPVLITLNLSYPMFKISPVILITCKKGYGILWYLLTICSRHSIYYSTKSSYIMYFLLYVNIKSISNLLYSR